MPKSYTVYISVYHRIDNVEADSPEEAEELATTDYIWDDHITDCCIEAEGNDDGWDASEVDYSKRKMSDDWPIDRADD